MKLKSIAFLGFFASSSLFANAYTLKSIESLDSIPVKNLEVQIAPKANLHPQGALTFFWGTGSSVLLEQVAKTLKDNLKFDFPDIGTEINGPNVIGYQFHAKEKVTLGMVYSNSSIKTNNLVMPDFQNPSDSTVYYYNVGLNSLLMQVDWFWGKIRRPKSTFSFHSGLGLGMFSFNLTTEKVKGSGNSVQFINNSVSTSGFQLTLIGVKHTMNALHGLGWFANLGVGVNSIGFTSGINYTL